MHAFYSVGILVPKETRGTREHSFMGSRRGQRKRVIVRDKMAFIVEGEETGLA